MNFLYERTSAEMILLLKIPQGLPCGGSLEKLNDTQKDKIYKKIMEQNSFAINQFMSSLQLKLNRKIIKIHIWVMFGKQYIFDSIEKAKEFIVNVKINDISPEFNKYEAEIQYSNGDIIRIEYRNQSDMLGFLSSFI